MANDLDQSVSNAIAGGVSAPIDLIAWALRKAGVPGVEKPFLGSDWMREKGLTRPVKSQGAAIVGETIGNLLDPAAAAGKTAILLPFIAKNLREVKRVAKAEDLAKQGATAQGLWRETKLFKYPRTEDSLTQTRWGHEVPAGRLMDDPADPKTYDPITGVAKLEDMYYAPELFRELPQLQDVQVKLDPMHRAGAYFASGEGPTGTVALARVLRTPGEIPGILSHELTHAANSHASQLQSLGATSREVVDPGIAKFIAKELRKDPRRQKMADIVDSLPMPLDHSSPVYAEHWGRDMGERLAEASKIRDTRSSVLNEMFSPTHDLYKGMWAPPVGTQLIPSDIARYVHEASYLPEQDALTHFLRSIRQNYK